METLVGGASAAADTLKDTFEVLADIMTKAGNGTFTLDELKRFAKRENPFVGARLSKHQRALWERFYRDEFKMEVDFSEVRVPDNPGGFDRVLVIAQGVTIGMVVIAMRNYFKVWTYIDD